MANIRADLWIYPLKLWGFFPKQTAKKFVWISWGWEVQIRNCRSFPNSQMSQSSHLILASPTWHISCAWGWFPRRWAVGCQGGRSRQCWALDPSTPPSDPLARGRKVRPTWKAKACRAAKGPNITLPCDRQGFILNWLLFQIRVPSLHGKGAPNQWAGVWRCHGTKGLVVRNPLLSPHHTARLLENSNNNSNNS